MEKKLHLYLLSCVTLTFLTALLVLLFFSFSFLPENTVYEISNSGAARELAVDADKEDPILKETSDPGQEYIDKIIFLGESTTYGLQRYGLLPDDQVWTGATCTDGLVKSAGTLSLSPSIDKTRIFYPDTSEALTVGEALSRKKPEYLIITLGLNNGASYYSEDEFKQCYRILLNAVVEASEETTVVLQSLFPVSRACRIKAYTPERIQICNSWICDIASEYEIYYLDTSAVLADENGYLFPEYDNGGDGIHLNAAGLASVLSYVKTHGVTTQEEVIS